MPSRSRVLQVVEPANPEDEDTASRAFDALIITLIVLSVLAIVLESVASIQARAPLAFSSFEIFAVTAFSLEYGVRLWAITADSDYSHPVLGRLRYALRPMLLIDLLAIAPFYLGFAVDGRFMRALRILRLFRLAKLGRYSRAMQALGAAFASRKEELVIATVSMMLAILVAASALYYVEYPHQPEAFSSIPASMWWGVATLTTVGYGDIAPITAAGKTLGGAVALFGVAMFAVPTGILGAAFADALEGPRSQAPQCPVCGEDLSDAASPPAVP